jgi:RNA recognition motif-containing protein
MNQTIPQLHSTDISFAISLTTNVVLFVVFYLLFELCRHFQSNKSAVYEAMCSKTLPNSVRVEQPSNILFGWIKSTWNVTNDDIGNKRGPHVLMYLNFLKYMFFISLGYGLYGWTVLFITHSLSGGQLKGMAMLGMGNIPIGSNFYIADIIGVYWNTIIGCIGLYIMYRNYHTICDYYKDTLYIPNNYTIIVQGLPEKLNEIHVKELFESVFPNKILYVNRAYTTHLVNSTLNKRQRIGIEYERALMYYNQKSKRKLIRNYCCSNYGRGKYCTKIDALDYYGDKFKIQDEILQIQQNTTLTNFPTKTAFVTFKDIITAKLANQSKFQYNLGKLSKLETSKYPLEPSKYPLETSKYPLETCPLDTSLTISKAPMPESILWDNLNVEFYQRWLRSCVVNVLTFLLIFFWMIPIGFAVTVSNLNNLIKLLPFLKPILDMSPSLKKFVEGFLPSVVIIVFFAILAKAIITPLSKFERPWNQITILQSIFNKYYLFMVINIFLGSIFVSGFFNIFEQIIDNPNTIIRLLSMSLPNQNTYFINYIMTMSLSRFALQLWRPDDLIHMWIIRYIIPFFVSSSSRRDQRKSNGPFYFHMHIKYAIHCLVFIITSCYSIMNPLITPFACIYFGLAWITDRYNLIYVYTPYCPGQEKIFHVIFTRLCWSLIVFQLVLAGTISLGLHWGGIAIAPLLVLQLLFWKLTQDQFCYDELISLPNNNIETVFPSEDTYKCPVLRKPLFQLEDDQETNNNSSINSLSTQENDELLIKETQTHVTPLWWEYEFDQPSTMV